MVDMGGSCKKITEKLEELDLLPEDIDGILISHEHIDHIKGLEVFLKNTSSYVYTTKKIYDQFKFEIDNFESVGEEIKIGDVDIEVVKTSHDSSDSIGFIFKTPHQKIVHLTDLGYINSKMLTRLKGANSYTIESNYEDEMLLANKNYPFQTKKRILSDRGHLSNYACNEYLRELVNDNTKNIFFAHLSMQNNNRDIVLKYNENIKVPNKYVLDELETSSHILE